MLNAGAEAKKVNIKILQQKLQTAKEENKELELRNDKLCLKVAELAVELQTAKEENKELETAIELHLNRINELENKNCSECYNDRHDKLADKVDDLTQRNKQLREALEEIVKVKLYNMPVNIGDGEKNYLKWYDLEHNAGLEMQNLAQQALKGGLTAIDNNGNKIKFPTKDIDYKVVLKGGE